LILYTDGVIEARSVGREFFGEERLTDLALQMRGWPAQAVCEGVMTAVASHGAGLPQQDDITVLCARRLRGDDAGGLQGRSE
jgi:serine phosphatase RsbU (regulator of sigma subunit)